MIIPTQIDLHEQILRQSDAEIEDKYKTISLVNEEFCDSNNFEDRTEHFKVQEDIERNNTTGP